MAFITSISLEARRAARGNSRCGTPFGTARSFEAATKNLNRTVLAESVGVVLGQLIVEPHPALLTWDARECYRATSSSHDLVR